MNGILNIIKNKDSKIHSDIINTSKRNWIWEHYISNVYMIEADYVYTKSNNGRKKDMKKYFIINMNTDVTLDSFRAFFKEWFDVENQNRKNPFINVKLKNIRIIEKINIQSRYNNLMQSLGFNKSRNAEYDFSNITDVLGFFSNKPSKNPKDYAVLVRMCVDISRVKIKYKTERGRKHGFSKEKEQYVVVLRQNNLNEIFERRFSPGNVIEEYYRDFNKKYSCRPIYIENTTVIDNISINI